MVDRSSFESRKRVFKMAKERLQNGVSMAIFPEGLVPSEDVVLAPFKKGAFSLAIEFGIPIIPQVYYDCKRFFSWDVFKGRPGVLRVQQYNFIETKGLSLVKDMEVLKNKTFNIIYKDLEKDVKYMKDTNRKR
jgi:1-acyl-sn-glycerol-3-phosphate acyltransferase